MINNPKRVFVVTAMALLLSAVAGIIWTGFAVARVSHNLQTIDAIVSTGDAFNADRPIDELRRDMQSAEAALTSIRRDVSLLTWAGPLLRIIPGYGGDIRYGGDLLDYALHLVRAADLTLQGVGPAVALVSSNDERSPDDILSVLAATFQVGRKMFLDARDEMVSARGIRGRIVDEKLSLRIRDRLHKLDALAESLESVVALGIRAPETLTSFRRTLKEVEDLNRSFDDFVIGRLTLAELSASLRDAQDRIQDMQAVLAEFGSLPPIGTGALGPGMDFASLEVMLDLGAELAEAATLVIGGLEPVARVSAEREAITGTDELFRDLTEALTQNRSGFLQAREALEQARVLRRQVAPNVLGSYLSAVDTRLLTLGSAVQFALEGPELMAKVRAVREEMNILVGLISRERLLRPDPDQLRATRELLTVVRADLTDIMTTWRGVKPLYPILDRLQLADGLAVEEALAVGATVTTAADSLIGAMMTFVAQTGEGGFFTESFGDGLEKMLATWADSSTSALKTIATLHPNNGEKQGEATPYILDVTGLFAPQLTRLEGVFELAVASSQISRELLGFNEPVTVLVLGQDDQELRPTGGFIGSVVEASFERGVPTIRQFRDSYDIDPPNYEGLQVGPEAFWKYMAGLPGLMTFRDSNWSPDFPVAAEEALRFYELTQESRPKVVIAMDTRALAGLVDALGDVQVPGIEGALDADAARAIMAGLVPYVCRSEHNSTKQNRCFSEDLTYALLDRMQEPNDPYRVSRTLFDLLEEKHIQLYTRDQKTQALLRKFNWDGKQVSPDGDYLMAVDWTAYSKARDRVERSLIYEVSISDEGEVAADLTIRYDNTAQKTGACSQVIDDPRACYWNYLRVYVPNDIELEMLPVYPLPSGSLLSQVLRNRGEEPSEVNTFEFVRGDQHAELSAFMIVDGGERSEYRFSYLLPGLVLETPEGNWLYRLTVQKQAGTVGDELIVRIRVPQGTELLSSSHIPIRDGDTLTFSLTLDLDQEIWALFLPPRENGTALRAFS